MAPNIFTYRARAQVNSNLALAHTCKSIVEAYESIQSVEDCINNPIYVWAWDMWCKSMYFVNTHRGCME